MKQHSITTTGWGEYELLDSGNNRKLERFGTVVLDRPDLQALWQKQKPELWIQAQAQFIWADKGQPAPDLPAPFGRQAGRKGGLAGERWKIEKDVPESWHISWKKMKLVLSMKGFKHIGIFPEHVQQWEEVQSLGAQYPGLKMLNLFGYTGAASIAGALAGMQVTHVDASKAALATVKENMHLSSLPKDSIRMLGEDSLKYVKRLISRGESFDVILLDPPAFGRGPKGEVWKIEESLYELLTLLPQLLSATAKMIILNGYASGYSARTFGELMQGVCPDGEITYGDIGIQEKDSPRIVTTGIYSRWKR